MEDLKNIITGFCLIGLAILITIELIRIGRSLYLLYRINKLSYCREHIEDEEYFIKGCEMLYGKLKQTFTNAIVLLDLVQCEKDMTKFVYDLSQYDEKRVIAIQVTHPWSNSLMKKPLSILPNQTVYIFENGAVQWRCT